jgi:hypothetical protein
MDESNAATRAPFEAAPVVDGYDIRNEFKRDSRHRV